jgi:hypothetical protein
MCRWLSTVIIALVLQSCSDPADLVDPLERAQIEEYGGGVTVSVFESPGEHPGIAPGDFRSAGREPGIVLAIHTFAKAWFCADARLHTDVEIGEGVITATVGRITVQPVPCAIATPIPAVFSQFLPIGEGDFELRVVVGSQKRVFDVRVSTPAIQVVRKMPALFGSRLIGGVAEPAFETFWRFPRRSLSVYCSRGWEDGACERLNGELTRLFGLSRITFPAMGELPFGATVRVDERATYFQYSSEISASRLREVVCGLVPPFEPTAIVQVTLRVVTWTAAGADSVGCRE